MADITYPSLFELCTRRAVVRRAAKIALVVGTILAIINHGDRLINMTADAQTFAKIALTYLVPYSLSTFSAVLTIRERLQEEAQA